ncbi:hypothetical protein DM860_015927 [Cuscuta australis]|uniref:Uncharacterized protein n=1 Tax=Cuscuta australis TaxID=267555 RepID=A0A328DZZ6_9ASTE|nr:hypothetical protein DM860_015927 [Cuscuta australis]
MEEGSFPLDPPVLSSLSLQPASPSSIRRALSHFSNWRSTIAVQFSFSCVKLGDILYPKLLLQRSFHWKSKDACDEEEGKELNRRRVEELSLTCDAGIPAVQRCVDALSESFRKSLETTNSRVQETV